MLSANSSTFYHKYPDIKIYHCMFMKFTSGILTRTESNAHTNAMLELLLFTAV